MGDILRLVFKRLGLGVITLFVVSILIFFAVELLPGDIAQAVLGQGATPETVAALREKLGLDQPAIFRYFQWLAGALTGDFGVSLVSGERVSAAISDRFINTLFLATYAAVIAVPISIILGVIVALLRNTLFDRVANVVTLTSISSPEFFLGYILILYLAVKTNYFPAIASLSADMSFADLLHRTFLPALTLVLVVTAHMMRMTRAAIINLLASPYIEMARLKGVPPWKVIVKHALPNAWAPIINVVALNLAYLITGVVLVEVVFVYPGIGQLLVDAVAKRDFPIVQACCLIFAATFILLNLAADVGAILTNPRLRHRSEDSDMSTFVIGYYALLIGASCLAAYFKRREIFLLIFSLTLVSFVTGIVGGAPALRLITTFAGLLALAAGTSYAFREFLILITPEGVAKELRTAPLTAAFGMFVIFTYAIAGIFAPVIAPFGEAQVISSAFAPPDETMLLGADQLGRDMFSRIIYGARNSVGLALLATGLAFFMGAFAGLLAATKGAGSTSSWAASRT